MLFECFWCVRNVFPVIWIFTRSKQRTFYEFSGVNNVIFSKHVVHKKGKVINVWENVHPCKQSANNLSSSEQIQTITKIDTIFKYSAVRNIFQRYKIIQLTRFTREIVLTEIKRKLCHNLFLLQHNYIVSTKLSAIILPPGRLLTNE